MPLVQCLWLEVFAKIPLLKENLEDIVASTLNHHLAKALREIRAAYEDRMKNLEETCGELEKALKFEMEKHYEETRRLGEKVRDLELRLEQHEVEANFLIDGLPEEKDEDTTQLVLCTTATLNAKLDSHEIISAIRSGRPGSSGASRRDT